MIWKALSDPTRRSILDLLKRAPRTTGEISDHFSKNLSRFAIMKHLGILEKAHLITTRKEGKSRWNFLNPAPIQKTYHEWVDQLIQLQYYTDQNTPMMEANDRQILSTSISATTNISATQTKTWKAFTKDISKWWTADYFEINDTKKMVLETKLGGLLYEDAGKGNGLIRATVIALQSPHHILLRGDLSPKSGGPALSYLKFNFEENKTATTLTLTITLMGTLRQKRIKAIEATWKKLLGNLKQHTEQM